MSDITLGITLKANGDGLIGEVKLSAAEMKKLGRETDKAGREAEKSGPRWRRMSRDVKGSSDGFKGAARNARLLQLAIVALATGGLARLGGGFIDVAAETEGYRTRLVRLLGDQQEANKLFEDAARFASRVPFEYREIMSAATQLAGVLEGGSQEVMETLPLISDLAAVSRLSIEETTGQVVRMFSAGAASADLFRERGILAMLGFEAGVTVSAEETRKQLIAAWEDPMSKFRGASADQADDWTGLMSMMADKWFGFRDDVMASGPFEDLKQIFVEINDAWTDNADGMESTAARMGQAISSEIRAVALDVARLIDDVNRLLALPDRARQMMDSNIREAMARAGAPANGTTVALVRTPDGGLASPAEADRLWSEYYSGDGPGPAEQRTLSAFERSDTNQTDRAMSGLLVPTATRPRTRAGAASRSDAEAKAIEDRIRENDEILGGMLGGEMPADGGMQAVVAEQHAEAVESLREAYRSLLPEYDRAVLEADDWRAETLAGLDQTAEGYDAYAAQVEAVYQGKIKAAYDKNLEDSRDWSAGAEKAFTDYADSATNAAANVERALTSGFGTMEDALVDFTTGTKVEWAGMVDAMIADIARLMIRQSITGPIAQSLAGVDFGSLFGGGTTAAVAHAGGVVGRDALAARHVPAGIFAGAARFHTGGIAGLGPDEVPIIARRNEEVVTPGDPRHRMNGGGQQVVTLRIVDAEGNAVEGRERRGGNGQLDIEVTIDQLVGRLGRKRGSATRRMLEDLGAGPGLRSV